MYELWFYPVVERYGAHHDNEPGIVFLVIIKVCDNVNIEKSFFEHPELVFANGKREIFYSV